MPLEVADNFASCYNGWRLRSNARLNERLWLKEHYVVLEEKLKSPSDFFFKKTKQTLFVCMPE